MAGIFREIDGRRGVLPDMPSVLIAGDHMHETFLQLHRAFDDGDSRLQRDSMLLGFFRRLAARVRKENVPKYRDACEISGVRSAREFLHAHFDCEVSLRDLAAIAGLSPYYFHRVFCRTLGLPPHAYQLQVRIMRAKSMIRDGRPLAHVAAATGFADQSHFTRHFKRLTGTTPARYAG